MRSAPFTFDQGHTNSVAITLIMTNQVTDVVTGVWVFTCFNLRIDLFP